MMKYRRQNSSVALSGFMVAVLSAFSVPANAETQFSKDAVAKAEAALAKVKAACAQDVKSFCSTVTPGEGRLLLCIMAHEDKMSDACFDSMLTVVEGVDLAISNVRRAAAACDEDIEKHCADVELGKGRIVQCLIDKKAEISTPCRAEVTGLESRTK